jgi:Flp pilus assembly protein TadD
MIVKNEEQHLARCLASLKPVVDEMIIVDTGSSDRTMEIAAAFGAKVFQRPWTDDFSEARNHSLAFASGAWILVMDADEVVSPEDHERFAALVKKSGKKTAFSFTTRNYLSRVDIAGWIQNDGEYQEQAGTGWIPSTKVRLFPRDERIRFEGSVHELVDQSIERLGVVVQACDIPVHHYGKMSSADGKDPSKMSAYRSLGQAKLDARGSNDVKALQELAVQENELGHFKEALEIYERLVKLNPRDASAQMGVGSNLMGLQRFEDALEPFKTTIQLDPDRPEVYVKCSIAYLALGRASEATPVVKHLMERAPHYPYSKPMHAAVLFCSGEKQEAVELVRDMKQSNISFDGFFGDLAGQLKSLGRVDYARAILEPLYELDIINRDNGLLLVECYKAQALVA